MADLGPAGFSDADLKLIRMLAGIMNKSDYALYPPPPTQTDEEAEAELMSDGEGYIDAVEQEGEEA